MTHEERMQVARDYMADIVMNACSAVTLADEGDWEEAAEYVQILLDKAGDFEEFCAQSHREHEKAAPNPVHPVNPVKTSEGSHHGA